MEKVEDVDGGNWRFSVTYLAHVVPMALLMVEMSMNRLRLPFHHVIYTGMIIGAYFLITYCYEAYDNFDAIFPHSLNWKCKFDYSYLYNTTTQAVISDTIKPFSCSMNMKWHPKLPSDFSCKTMYPYYCRSPD